MIELYLIRHAESMMNENGGVICGRSNHTPLSKKGELQADLLGKRLLLERVIFDKIYSSTSVRASRTADIVCGNLDYPSGGIVRSDEILELSQGDWEGKSRSEVYTAEMLDRINSDNWNFKAPNGESQREKEERMYSFIEKEVLSRYDPSRKVPLRFGFFSHGMAIKCVVRKVLDSSPKMTYKIMIDNTGITKLKYDDKGWHLLSLNDIAHLV